MRKKDSQYTHWYPGPSLYPLDRSGFSPDLQDDPARVMDAWYEIVGPLTAENARPLRFEAGTLIVRVTSPIWLQELNLHKGRLIQELNEALGRYMVRTLRLEIGLLPPMPSIPEPPRASCPQEQLPTYMLDEIEARLAHLPENDLKQTARRIMAKHYQKTRLPPKQPKPEAA